MPVVKISAALKLNKKNFIYKLPKIALLDLANTLEFLP